MAAFIWDSSAARLRCISAERSRNPASLAFLIGQLLGVGLHLLLLAAHLVEAGDVLAHAILSRTRSLMSDSVRWISASVAAI